MELPTAKLAYLLRMGDNALILGQRLSEWCGHGPILEQDIAITNIALDLMGQARTIFGQVAELEGKGRSEDELAFLRYEREYRNVLLVEQPNEDFAHTIVRQFLFDAFHYPFYEALLESRDETMVALAGKAIKEVTYHLRYSSEWMIRLGDGTEVSHQKMQDALDHLWAFSGELYTPDALDEQLAAAGIGVDLEVLKAKYLAKVSDILAQATLRQPESEWMQAGGKQGRHTESMGYILAEMQYMQRAYPGLEW
ncbi:MAG: 1,2-phenylacetyl-CoA epoxidase subunit PaaC [Bacteroidota bacterium]